MTLPLNQPLPFTRPNIMRLVPASLAGQGAHVLRVHTPSAPDTLHFLSRLYDGQRCRRVTVASPMLPGKLDDIIRTVAMQLQQAQGPLVVMAVCGLPDALHEELFAGLAPLLADRPETALVELLPFYDLPQITHYLSCADAQSR